MKIRPVVLPALVALIPGVLTGCGGSSFNGTLNTGGGSGPTPPAGTPTVTALSPSSAVAGGQGFTLTVTGTNFKSGDTVEWGFTPLTSIYVSSTEMTAQVPASDIATPGGITVIVVTPTPASMNFGALFTISVPPLTGNTSFTLSSVTIEANDMVWDPVSQLMYLSVPSSNAANGDTITTLNPATGQLGVSQAAGGEPDRLAVTSEGSYLYAGIDASGAVQRYTLPNLGADISIPLGSYSASQPYFAMDVESAPGSPHTVAVVRGVSGISPTEQGGVVIYDDAVPRATSVPGAMSGVGPIDVITWNSGATDLFGIDTELFPSGDLYELAVGTGGVQLAQDFKYQSISGFNGVHYDATTGYVYSDTGMVIDPASGAVVGSYPTGNIQGGYSLGPVMVPDGSLHIAYFLGQTQYGNGLGEWALEAYDLTHFTFLGAVALTNVVGTPVKLLRWGSNGLAFVTGMGNGHGPVQGDGVYILSGAFVTSPASRNSGTVPQVVSFRPFNGGFASGR
ncbi:MAG: IPT/TIG domain-containing protein [Acidobacteriota bacterium]|nr:IPT/TIG domain-containing protein [Acidobacteriota bacterium]